MTLENLLTQLVGIRAQVTNLPFEPDNTTEERLKAAYEDLEKLLPQIQALTKEDRERIYLEVKSFMSVLEERLTLLNNRMDELRKAAESTSSHLQGAKAYSGKIF